MHKCKHLGSSSSPFHWVQKTLKRIAGKNTYVENKTAGWRAVVVWGDFDSSPRLSVQVGLRQRSYDATYRLSGCSPTWLPDPELVFGTVRVLMGTGETLNGFLTVPTRYKLRPFGKRKNPEAPAIGTESHRVYFNPVD